MFRLRHATRPVMPLVRMARTATRPVMAACQQTNAPLFKPFSIASVGHRLFANGPHFHPLSNTLSKEEMARLDAEAPRYIMYEDHSGRAEGEGPRHLRGHNNFENPVYDKIYDEARKNPEAFWDEKGKQIHWFKPYTTVLDNSNPHFPRWYPDGETNICYNALDKNVNEGRGDQAAFHYVSSYTGRDETITYAQLLDKVGRFASILQKKFGIQPGDRVIIYMPMVPEAAMAMLACARIGAVHSVVFGGFAAEELQNRIDNSEAKLIITATKGIEPRRHIDYLTIVQDALNLCKRVKNAP